MNRLEGGGRCRRLYAETAEDRETSAVEEIPAECIAGIPVARPLGTAPLRADTPGPRSQQSLEQDFAENAGPLELCLGQQPLPLVRQQAMPVARLFRASAAPGAREAKESTKARHTAALRCSARLMQIQANISSASRIPRHELSQQGGESTPLQLKWIPRN
jgi:hypothetical protein